MGPATLSFCRLAIGSLVLVPLALAQRREDRPLSRSDRWSIFWMGLSGFAAAFAFGNWGLRLSTATNAALLITVEPVSLILLSPLVLGERLTRREGVGALLTVVGVLALRETLTIYTVAGGVLILIGVHTNLLAKRAQRGSIG